MIQAMSNFAMLISLVVCFVQKREAFRLAKTFEKFDKIVKKLKEFGFDLKCLAFQIFIGATKNYTKILLMYGLVWIIKIIYLAPYILLDRSVIGIVIRMFAMGAYSLVTDQYIIAIYLLLEKIGVVHGCLK